MSSWVRRLHLREERKEAEARRLLEDFDRLLLELSEPEKSSKPN